MLCLPGLDHGCHMQPPVQHGPRQGSALMHPRQPCIRTGVRTQSNPAHMTPFFCRAFAPPIAANRFPPLQNPSTHGRWGHPLPAHCMQAVCALRGSVATFSTLAMAVLLMLVPVQHPLEPAPSTARPYSQSCRFTCTPTTDLHFTYVLTCTFDRPACLPSSLGW